MKAMDREPPAFPYDLVFTKCSTLKLFVALSALLKKNGFYLNSWFLFKYLVSSAQAQVPFPFPLVPGSHADTSIINNASDPSNMPLAGNCSIPHDSGPALGCSCFRRSWLPWRSRYGTLKASPQISFWRQWLWWASSPHSSPDLRDFMGVCKGVCWWGELDKWEDVGTPQSHSPQTLCLWSCSYLLKDFRPPIERVQPRFCVNLEKTGDTRQKEAAGFKDAGRRLSQMLEPSLSPSLPEFWLLTGRRAPPSTPSIPWTQSKFHPPNQKPMGGWKGVRTSRDGHFISSCRKQPVMGFDWTVFGQPLPKLQKS